LSLLDQLSPQDTIQVITDDVPGVQSQCPDYMSNTVSLVSDDPGRRRLRSATSTDYHVPRTALSKTCRDSITGSLHVSRRSERRLTREVPYFRRFFAHTTYKIKK